MSVGEHDRRRELAQVREAIERWVPGGFRDDDGIWHAGPHALCALTSLDALAAELVSVCEERDRLRDALEEVHEHQCGCEQPGSAALCVAKPEGTFAALSVSVPDGQAEEEAFGVAQSAPCESGNASTGEAGDE